MGRVLRAAALGLLVALGAYVIATMKRTAVGVAMVMLAVWAWASARGRRRLATSAALAALISFALAYVWPQPRLSWIPAALLSLLLLPADVGAFTLRAAYLILGRPLPVVNSKPSEIVRSEFAARGRAHCFMLLSRRGARFLGAFAPVRAMGYRCRYWYSGKIAKLPAAADSCVVELVVSGEGAEVVVHFMKSPSRTIAKELGLSAARVKAASTRVEVAELVREFDSLASIGWGGAASPHPADVPAMYEPLRKRLARGWRRC